VDYLLIGGQLAMLRSCSGGGNGFLRRQPCGGERKKR
jgi:hypothetical protein